MQVQDRITDRSFLSWLGGKSLLADKIIPLIPEHRCYVEVFAGAAWLLFKKSESKVEIINDINLDLVTLYRVVKHHLDEFVRYFRWALVARDEFERLKKEEASALTDIQRAARFFYLTRVSYGSMGKRFAPSTTQPAKLNLLRLEEQLSAAHLRLARVYIENKPYAELIDRYDRPHTFFYVDPPYFGCEDYYGGGIFERDDFTRLAEQLSRIRGRFILSINDTKEVRAIFRGFRVREVTTTYTVRGAKRVRELLVTNYAP